jgi:hypothetical protein
MCRVKGILKQFNLFFLYIFILIDTLMSAMHYIVWPPTNLVLKKYTTNTWISFSMPILLSLLKWQKAYADKRTR